MADLKTTIAQTENLKNKVKLAKDRINETVVRGGGITSKSLSEIPDNIKSMINQYNKVAIKKYETDFLMEQNGSINLNLEFNPKMVIVTVAQNKKSLGDNRTSIKDIIIPNIMQNNEFAIWWQSNYTYEGMAYFSKDSLSWSKISSTMMTKIGYIRQIIAIG